MRPLGPSISACLVARAAASSNTSAGSETSGIATSGKGLRTIVESTGCLLRRQGPGPTAGCTARAGRTPQFVHRPAGVSTVPRRPVRKACAEVTAALLGDGQCAADGPEPGERIRGQTGLRASQAARAVAHLSAATPWPVYRRSPGCAIVADPDGNDVGGRAARRLAHHHRGDRGSRLVPHAAQPGALAAGRGGRVPGHAAGAQPDPGGGARPDGPGHGKPPRAPALLPVAGVVFLLYPALGHLPALFALPAGLGDIAAGIAAPLTARRLAQGTGRRAAQWFNAFGITDLIVALTLGALTGYQLLNVTPSSAPIGELPLAVSRQPAHFRPHAAHCCGAKPGIPRPVKGPNAEENTMQLETDALKEAAAWPGAGGQRG